MPAPEIFPRSEKDGYAKKAKKEENTGEQVLIVGILLKQELSLFPETDVYQYDEFTLQEDLIELKILKCFDKKKDG